MSPPPPPHDRKLLLAVDAPSLLHRNHHARADTGLRDRSGRPAWALHGMLRQILDAIDQFAPDDLDIQMAVKDVFDPKWLLNPAKVFPLQASQARRAA